MTGTTRTSADLDPRRRRLLVRAWRRGIREMDLILGGFADQQIADLTEAELDTLETLMGEDDADLLSWINGEKECPPQLATPLFERIAAFRPQFGGDGGLKTERTDPQ
ncbi:succinate dehydrogenase assembly factor 2 family protein [Pseudohoeflea suaedae]|uniref:FAD assembly factor SdhE n=1 Tax=Pseudohoeflea suaedae TaxID=877384 RepID=A0A4R5PRP1_9HYPH|nr:succinate dehydrogenase assembly factor 2 [Pseudohoeflea suaedae]TDH39321.1 succinate dehydrogenase assembly factor 2 family protein [Pseudohoeflea suaedae]